MTEYIIVKDAHEHNLKHIDVKIPKKKITVFTGVSGSGKSSLCMDTIAAESRRELNDTFPSFVQQYLPKYGRPHVGMIKNLPITMILDQKKPSANSRSTVGTYTDIYAFLRLMFSRIGRPFVGYSDAFSFNHPKGWCKKCQGIGQITELDIHKLVDFDKCLNDDGVINFPAFTTGAWRWKRYAFSGLFDLDKKIKDYSEEELYLLLYEPQRKLKDPPSNWPKSAKYEGIYPRMYRSIIYTKEGKRHQKLLDTMVEKKICPSCNGSRLNDTIRSCKIQDKHISDLLAMQVPELIAFVEDIEHDLIKDIKHELLSRLEPLRSIGLSYISLDRSMNSLSGGESQRIKIARYINSALTDVIYVLDEPSVGLHPHDILRLESAIYSLRDRGNTVLMVEHNKGIIALADWIIDIGPESGENGGYIVFEGSYDDLLKSDTITSCMLQSKTNFKHDTLDVDQCLTFNGLDLNNLKNIGVQIPLNRLTVVAGVAGSGKSSLAQMIAKEIDDCVFIDQSNIGANSRSTPATYLKISDGIRQLFAHENKMPLSYFSFNSHGGCKHCNGKGIVVSEMGFMDKIESVCEVCHGKRYDQAVLEYKYQGYNIADIFDLSAQDALNLFSKSSFACKLDHLVQVGLGYIHLNQSLNTLSGGELQRLKLASKLREKASFYILDEPTDGLHLKDVRSLISLFERMIQAGHSLLVIDHHLDVLKAAHYLIELGPHGGQQGGYLLYQGLPKLIGQSKTSITKKYID